ncbi:MAG TPA: hypothetical protein VEH06_16205 [Candidatus Bathyarchaeia archaeon]|nr:hypothetical protein [Candidatus Bathyarchaeia archaeon]
MSKIDVESGDKTYIRRRFRSQGSEAYRAEQLYLEPGKVSKWPLHRNVDLGKNST